MWDFQIGTMNFGRSGQPGRYSFFPKGALTHHPPMAGGGIPPVGRDRALSEGGAAPAERTDNALFVWNRYHCPCNWHFAFRRDCRTFYITICANCL